MDTAALNRLLTALVAMREGNFRKRLHGVRRRRDVGDRGGLQRGGRPQSAPHGRAGPGAADGRA
ncbi:hypothetical protein LV779_06170 [Streptomyces thinghirensis]|nr:hypothetical protein [Streptomyces thinghirensis]